MIPTILEDPREISCIEALACDPDAESKFYYQVGYQDVTKIEAYPEGGMHCDLAWFAVFKGDEIVVRVPATAVEVTYARKGEK